MIHKKILLIAVSMALACGGVSAQYVGIPYNGDFNLRVQYSSLGTCNNGTYTFDPNVVKNWAPTHGSPTYIPYTTGDAAIWMFSNKIFNSNNNQQELVGEGIVGTYNFDPQFIYYIDLQVASFEPNGCSDAKFQVRTANNIPVQNATGCTGSIRPAYTSFELSTLAPLSTTGTSSWATIFYQPYLPTTYLSKVWLLPESSCLNNQVNSKIDWIKITRCAAGFAHIFGTIPPALVNKATILVGDASMQTVLRLPNSTAIHIGSKIDITPVTIIEPGDGGYYLAIAESECSDKPHEERGEIHGGTLINPQPWVPSASKPEDYLDSMGEYVSSPGNTGLKDVASSNLYNASVTSIGNLSSGNRDRISIYPNPATIKLHVDGSRNSSYQIVDVTGRVLQTGKIEGSPLDVSQLVPGNYVLIVTKQNMQKEHFRFTKQL